MKYKKTLIKSIIEDDNNTRQALSKANQRVLFCGSELYTESKHCQINYS